MDETPADRSSQPPDVSPSTQAARRRFEPDNIDDVLYDEPPSWEQTQLPTTSYAQPSIMSPPQSTDIAAPDRDAYVARLTAMRNEAPRPQTPSMAPFLRAPTNQSISARLARLRRTRDRVPGDENGGPSAADAVGAHVFVRDPPASLAAPPSSSDGATQQAQSENTAGWRRRSNIPSQDSETLPTMDATDVHAFETAERIMQRMEAQRPQSSSSVEPNGPHLSHGTVERVWQRMEAQRPQSSPSVDSNLELAWETAELAGLRAQQTIELARARQHLRQRQIEVEELERHRRRRLAERIHERLTEIESTNRETGEESRFEESLPGPSPPRSSSPRNDAPSPRIPRRSRWGPAIKDRPRVAAETQGTTTTATAVPAYATSEQFLANGITKHEFDNTTKGTDDPKDRDCPICYTTYGGKITRTTEDAVRVNNCGHVFGRKCLQLHVASGHPSSSLCPMCRGPLYGLPQPRLARRRAYMASARAPPPHIPVDDLAAERREQLMTEANRLIREAEERAQAVREMQLREMLANGHQGRRRRSRWAEIGEGTNPTNSDSGASEMTSVQEARPAQEERDRAARLTEAHEDMRRRFGLTSPDVPSRPNQSEFSDISSEMESESDWTPFPVTPSIGAVRRVPGTNTVIPFYSSPAEITDQVNDDDDEESEETDSEQSEGTGEEQSGELDEVNDERIRRLFSPRSASPTEHFDMAEPMDLDEDDGENDHTMVRQFSDD